MRALQCVQEEARSASVSSHLLLMLLKMVMKLLWSVPVMQTSHANSRLQCYQNALEPQEWKEHSSTNSWQTLEKLHLLLCFLFALPIIYERIMHTPVALEAFSQGTENCPILKLPQSNKEVERAFSDLGKDWDLSSEIFEKWRNSFTCCMHKYTRHWSQCA